MPEKMVCRRSGLSMLPRAGLEIAPSKNNTASGHGFAVAWSAMGPVAPSLADPSVLDRCDAVWYNELWGVVAVSTVRNKLWCIIASGQTLLRPPKVCCRRSFGCLTRRARRRALVVRLWEYTLHRTCGRADAETVEQLFAEPVTATKQHEKTNCSAPYYIDIAASRRQQPRLGERHTYTCLLR